MPEAAREAAREAASRDALNRLGRVLDSSGALAIAVSGGVDSMILAHAAHHSGKHGAEIYHALSPATPRTATERVRRHAERYGWRLVEINAGEMADARYLENPVNRCFFCKTNLYSRIATVTDRVIVSGTNTDDLSDFRPGLEAARDHQVRHPYVEAGLAKADVRAIARHLCLTDLAELPAAPCLASRIETGLRVTEGRLALIEAVEGAVRGVLGEGVLRCRLRHSGVVIELEAPLLARVTADLGKHIEAVIADRGTPGPARFEPYRMGGAFLHEAPGPEVPKPKAPRHEAIR